MNVAAVIKHLGIAIDKGSFEGSCHADNARYRYFAAGACSVFVFEGQLSATMLAPIDAAR